MCAVFLTDTVYIFEKYKTVYIDIQGMYKV